MADHYVTEREYGAAFLEKVRVEAARRCGADVSLFTLGVQTRLVAALSLARAEGADDSGPYHLFEAAVHAAISDHHLRTALVPRR